MAIIKCPMCGAEISDKAKKCVHCGFVFDVKTETKMCAECGKENPIDAEECAYCGCPFEKQNMVKDDDNIVEISSSKDEKTLKRIIVPVIAGVLIVGIGFSVYNSKVVKPRNTYNEAIEYLEKGKYEEADELLKKITGYKNVDEVLEEIKYESCAYSAVNAVKGILKNPDSISVYDIKFYSGLKDSTNKEESEDKDSDDDSLIDEDHPYIIMHITAQNGFGGNTTNYATCSYNPKTEEYELGGITKSLDISELDKDDDDFFIYALTAAVISAYQEKGIEVGSIDMSRFKAILKNDAYSAIKIIE